MYALMMNVCESMQQNAFANYKRKLINVYIIAGGNEVVKTADDFPQSSCN